LLLQPNTHFIIVDKLASIRLSDAFTNGGAEPGLFIHHSQRGVLHKMFSIHSGMAGNTGNLGFLLGREMNFHAPKVSFSCFVSIR